MKRYKLMLAFAMALIMVLILVADQAEARTDGARARAVETFCSIGDPQAFWMDGNVVHGRNQPLTSITESNNPLFAGDNDIMANWLLDLDTSKGYEWGTFESTLAGNEGGGAGIWSGRARLSSVVMESGHPWWLLSGQGTGYGYGSSYGMVYHFTMRQTVTVYESLEEAEEAAPCVTGMTIDGRWFVVQSKVTFRFRK